jgi:hypothetical protein
VFARGIGRIEVPAGCARRQGAIGCNGGRAEASALPEAIAAPPTRGLMSSSTRYLSGTFLKSVATGVLHALKWFVHEFLMLLIHPVAGSGLAWLCRLMGCLVIAVSLRAELREGFFPNTATAVIQFALAATTAILFGNVVKEFAFDLCARCAMWSGRDFVRNGLTVTGDTFWEIQFRDGTWLRCETGGTSSSCEWTEPDGRCKRLELRLTA